MGKVQDRELRPEDGVGKVQGRELLTQGPGGASGGHWGLAMAEGGSSLSLCLLHVFLTKAGKGSPLLRTHMMRFRLHLDDPSQSPVSRHSHRFQG